jgi:hypothetical protein
MLHTFFFILSFLMDYQDMADALHGGFLLGLTNASLVCVVVAWRGFRGRMAAGNRDSSLRSRVEQVPSSILERTPSTGKI